MLEARLPQQNVKFEDKILFMTGEQEEEEEGEGEEEEEEEDEVEEKGREEKITTAIRKAVSFNQKSTVLI